MRHAIRTTVATFGTLAGLAGIEHGVGEILQGSVAPAGIVIQSWPNSPWFQILNGEPAMTLVPNLLVTGILATLCSAALAAWSVLFAHKKHGALGVIVLSLAALPVGGGFGPPLLGTIVGLTATRIHAPLERWRSRRTLAALWPWAYAGALASWMLLCPGTSILDRVFKVRNMEIVVSVSIVASFGLLILAILAALARDAGHEPAALRRGTGASRRLATRDGRA